MADITNSRWTVAGSEAYRLALAHGLDEQRVRKIIYKLGEIGFLATRVHSESNCPTALNDAITFLEPSKALQLFEDEDLERLAGYVHLTEYLFNSWTPLYTLEELANGTIAVISHLEHNRRELLRTGFPRSFFAQSPWLDIHLNKLYYVKLPLFDPSIEWGEDRIAGLQKGLSQDSSYIERDRDDNLIYHYVWTKESPKWEDETPDINLSLVADQWYRNTVRSRPDFDWIGKIDYDDEGKVREKLPIRAFTGDGRPVTACDYEEAPYLPGLDVNDATRLIALRENFFAVKTCILDRLLQAIRSRKVENLWIDCIQMLAKDENSSLSGNEAEFLMKIDDKLAEMSAGGEIYYPSPLLNNVHYNAGLVDLFEVIGHYEREISIGTMAKTKDSIMPTLNQASISSYYQAIAQPWRDDLNSVLMHFLHLHKAAEKFWKTYRQRVNRTIKSDFEEEVSFKLRVKRKDAESFKKYWSPIMKLAGTHPEMIFVQLRRGSPKTDKAVLTEKRKKDYSKYEYKCSDSVHIPGDNPKNRSNQILVNDHQIKIGDSLLALFLRFVLELKMKKGGWVNIQDLISEELIGSDVEYQKFSNLRTALAGSLLNSNGLNFIENDGSKRYRISTHPDFITYEKNKLKDHPDHKIANIAKKLPKSS